MSDEEFPCFRGCGYYSGGQDLIDHEYHEHRPCPDCGLGEEQDLRTYSLCHQSWCPRLVPGYVYPADAS